MFIILLVWIFILPIQSKIKITIFILNVIFSLLFIKKCITKKDYNKKRYNPIRYAELQSEKVTYSLWNILFSLTSSLSAINFSTTQTNINVEICAEDITITMIKVLIFLLGMNFLLLSSISYRHLTYAIYMQEYHRDKQKRICPFTQIKKACFGNNANEETKISRNNTGNTIQITCNTNEPPPVLNVTERDKTKSKQYDSSKVFISLFMK